MGVPELAAALRAQAAGYYPHEAAVELLIQHWSWLARGDFLRRYVDYEDDPAVTGGEPMAGVRWKAAITALNTGRLPASAGEGVILRIAASLYAGIPVDLRDLARLDETNARLVTCAIWHCKGRREVWTTTGVAS
ncbi:hypothetical protein C3Y87_03920 [Carbonactinospora thermoautotrophica]|nr:hypothetical protein [Carbonactinospora thermoautotrophica]